MIEAVRAGESRALVRARRAGCRQDGAVGLRGRAGVGLPCGACRGGAVGDGARVRWRCISCWRRCLTVSSGCRFRSAMRCGRRSASVPGRRRIASSSALAVLSLLSDVADERPLICLVDDEQWLDRASAQVLAFVARRLEAESVGSGVRRACAERGPSGVAGAGGRGAAEGDARALLDSVLTGPLDARVRDQIVTETRGNPLALLELAKGVDAGGAGGRVRTRRRDAALGDGSRRASGGGSKRFLPSTRRLLQLAAADPVGDPLLVWRAAGAARNPVRGRDAGGRGRPARVRRARAVSPSAGALGGLPVGVASGATGRAPRAGGGHRSGDRSRPPRLAPGAGRARRPTRTSPRNSSARPAERRRAGASPPRPRSSSARRC